VLQSKEYLKCSKTPDIDISMRHLPACQMIDYQEIPNAPVGKAFSCSDAIDANGGEPLPYGSI
jgi:hypothetical protein